MTNDADMLAEEEEKVLWRHPHGMDVLKRLGIVERSNASVSEGDDDFDHSTRFIQMPSADEVASNGGGFLSDENDDTEFIFDRASLLQQRHPSSDDDRVSSWFTNRRIHNMADSHRVSCCRGFLTALAFFIMGSCFSIIGPTLGNLQLLTKSDTLSSATSVVSANAFGAMIGIILCAGCGTLLQPFCVMMFALPLCSVTTLVVPWCTTLTSATMVFMLQGVSLGLIERAGYSVFNTYWRRRHSILILFYICSALGATISPGIISSFFALNPHNLSSSGALDSSNATSYLRREYRNASLFNGNYSSIGLLCNDTLQNCTTDFNSTSSVLAVTAPKEKKPPFNDATHLDPKISLTDKKEQELAKQKQAKVLETKANSTNTVSTANVTIFAPSTALKTDPPSTTVAATTPPPPPPPTTTTTTKATTSTLPSTSTAPTTSKPSSAATVPSSTQTTVMNATEAVMWTFNGDAWEKIKEEFAQMNSFQLAYVTVASIASILTVLFAVVYCFTPCSRHDTTGSSPAAEYRFHLNGLWKARTNFYAVQSAASFAFLLVSVEAIVASLLTIYAVVVDMSHLHGSIIATSIFWLGVSAGRIVSASFYGRLSQAMPMACFLGVALFSTGVVVVFGYWAVVWLVASVLGFCFGALYPLTYCWLCQQLTPAPWFSTVWCLASQLGRLVAPACASWAMVHHSAKDFLFALLVTTLLACIIYVMMRSTVREATKLINVEQQQRVTCKVKFPGNDTFFEYHHFNNVEGEDEVTCFDRSRDTKLANGTPPLIELNHKRPHTRH